MNKLKLAKQAQKLYEIENLKTPMKFQKSLKFRDGLFSIG